MGLYQTIADLLAETDPFVATTHEIDSIHTRDGHIARYARAALDIVLDSSGTPEPKPRRPFTCLGAGGGRSR